MVRVRNWWSHGKTVTLIWFSSAILFLLGFQMALRNSAEQYRSKDSEPLASNSERRSRLYDKMARDLDEHGAVFLQGGATSQSLALSDIFTVKDGIVTPILKAADPPVRANVLYLSPKFAKPISQTIKDIFLPYFDRGVPATEDEIEAEANSVKDVAEVLCPLKIVLDRVVLTSTGVLLGCWQVISGTDPITIRAKLRNALPRAPEKQLYDPVMLHTSFARLFGHPNLSSEEQAKYTNQLQLFHELVERVNNQTRGTEAVVSELWYVEEFDVLALALNGRMKERRFRLGCSRT